MRLTTSRRSLLNDLRAVVEVVPVVAGAHPVVVGGGVVGLVVGVGGRVVELAGLGVLAGGLGVKRSSGLTVEGGEPASTHARKLTAALHPQPQPQLLPRRQRPALLVLLLLREATRRSCCCCAFWRSTCPVRSPPQSSAVLRSPFALALPAPVYCCCCARRRAAAVAAARRPGAQHVRSAVLRMACGLWPAFRTCCPAPARRPVVSRGGEPDMVDERRMDG